MINVVKIWSTLYAAQTRWSPFWHKVAQYRTIAYRAYIIFYQLAVAWTYDRYYYYFLLFIVIIIQQRSLRDTHKTTKYQLLNHKSSYYGRLYSQLLVKSKLLRKFP